jgi:hypothetical protein
MKRKIVLLYLLLITFLSYSQTKVGGIIIGIDKEPIPYANVFFEHSNEGATSDENGNFYLESKDSWKQLKISFIGYKTVSFDIPKKVNYQLSFTLEEEENSLNGILLVTGKQPKKNNPAIDILRKIWEQKRKNGLHKFDQYQYKKYEKVEFDLNTIDSTFKKKKFFRGMEFAFKNIDTSKITGKTFLPIFLNESIAQVYGDNILKKKKEVVKGNKNSGFTNNQAIINFIGDLYNDYDIYDDYIELYYKSFVSPLSKTGINNYNYYLSDSTFIDNKWCYNIVYYPRRKNELTFKGDFWVNDSTFAIKEINLKASKSANINWIKDIYIEQEFDILNDSIFLLKRDYIESDFALSKKEKSRGIYGKRTTTYNNYNFNKELDKEFYDKKIYVINPRINNRSDEFWTKNRTEKLNKNELGVYKLLDTLTKVSKFKNIYTIIATLSSGYFEFDKLNFDYGPIFSTVGFNDVEGLRLRAGGRTYFGYNDPWRIEAYTAYGFKDRRFKYGFQGKVLLDRRNRLILSGGNKKDIEQIGASLTASNDIIVRSTASSSVIGSGANNRLTNLNFTMLRLEAEPIRNLVLGLSGNYKTLSSASSAFSLDYKDITSPADILSEVKQFETVLSANFYPGRIVTGTGVETKTSTDKLQSLLLQVSRGIKGTFNSDFNYTKVQLAYSRPWAIGGLGRLKTSLELGKTYGEVPLSLLSVIPGNQTPFAIFNTFNQLDFYEFVTDTYATFHLEHNFNGRLFSRIPLFRKLNLRTLVGFKTAWGALSEENFDLNTTRSSDDRSQVKLRAPEEKPYYEYSVGVGNIFKFLRVDFNFRGNYLEASRARKSGITFATGFLF